MKKTFLFLIFVIFNSTSSASEFYEKFLNKLTTIKTYSINEYICENIYYSSGKDLKKMHCSGNGKCLLNEKNNYSIKELYSSPEKGTRSDYSIFYKISESGNRINYAWIGTANKEYYLLPEKLGVLGELHEVSIPVVWEERVVNNQRWLRLPSARSGEPLWVKDDEKVPCKNEIRDYSSSERFEKFNSYAIPIKLTSGNDEILTTANGEIIQGKILLANHKSVGELGGSMDIFIEKVEKGMLFYKILEDENGKCENNFEVFKEEFSKGTIFKINLQRIIDKNGFFKVKYVLSEYSYSCFLKANGKDFQKLETTKK